VSANGFDRLRPRTTVGVTAAPGTRDAEGKRALFSPAETERPTSGGITVECSRCDQTTVFTPMAALRAAFPAVHLSLGIARGDNESTIGLFRRRHGSWLRCPACGHGAWVRVTIRL
jgi:hypothetical protein